MRLLFDARYIRTDFHDGISRFTAQLGAAVHELAPDEVVFLIHDLAQVAHLPTGARWVRFHSPESVLEPLAALSLNRYRPDVVFSPLQTLGTWGRRYKAALTLHDLIYYRHRRPPGDLNPLTRLLWRAYHISYAPQRLVLNGADAVATVSHVSKHEILAHQLTHRPVVVIPNAARDDLGDLRPKDPGKGPVEGRVEGPGVSRNLIYMGSFMGYKNVETLIRAMALLPGHTLHLLSRVSARRRAQLAGLVPAGARVVFHNGVSDAEYVRLLTDDALLVTASLDEGYGLPIAEAHALGVPAVVSDIAIFHEVAGPGALYFPPEDAAAFAAQVRALSDPGLRASIAEAAATQSSLFSWQRSARVLLDLARGLAR